MSLSRCAGCGNGCFSSWFKATFPVQLSPLPPCLSWWCYFLCTKTGETDVNTERYSNQQLVTHATKWSVGPLGHWNPKNREGELIHIQNINVYTLIETTILGCMSGCHINSWLNGSKIVTEGVLKGRLENLWSPSLGLVRWQMFKLCSSDTSLRPWS